MMMAEERLIAEYKATPQDGAPTQPVCDQRAGDGGTALTVSARTDGCPG